MKSQFGPSREMRNVNKLAQIKCQAVAHIDRYFSGVESAGELRTWALAQSIFANPKGLDNDEDWAVSNALALMVWLTDDALDRSLVEKGLHEARQFLVGDNLFPEGHWPMGLASRKL